MLITLKPELFATAQFMASFKEKLKSCRHHDYNPKHLSLSPEQQKHYEYGRAVKGVVAEFAFMGLLWENNIDYHYNKKLYNAKFAPDIDFILLPSQTKIDVKAGFSYFKPELLEKNKINHIVIAVPQLNQSHGVYKMGGYTMVTSYRQLFKHSINVDIVGYISVKDVLNAFAFTDSPSFTQMCEPIDQLFKSL